MQAKGLSTLISSIIGDTAKAKETKGSAHYKWTRDEVLGEIAELKDFTLNRLRVRCTWGALLSLSGNCDPAVTRHPAKTPDEDLIRIQKLVGGPGFEPGASRSRNLGRFVHRDRFRAFLDSIGDVGLALLTYFEPFQMLGSLHELVHEKGSGSTRPGSTSCARWKSSPPSREDFPGA